MIRVKFDFNPKPLDDLAAYFQSYERIAAEEMGLAVQAVSPFMLAELRDTPGAVKYPIEWTSEKQRRAFFATDGFGNGIPYRRTGALQAAWNVSPLPSGVGMVVDNPNKAAVFVYGSLSANNPGLFQQRFHKNTGWQTAENTITFWFDALAEEFARRMDQRLGDLVGDVSIKRRAFTYTGRGR